MIERIARKLHTEEAGFTLIELMVVVLIIGILIAIALPTFLGARSRAQDKAALSDLRNGIAAGKTFFTDGDTYTGFDATSATAVEPSLAWASQTTAPAAKTVAIVVASGNNLLLVRHSDSGTYFGISDQASTTGPGSVFCKSDTFANLDTVAECAALNNVG